jgi:hypothetical protein
MTWASPATRDAQIPLCDSKIQIQKVVGNIQVVDKNGVLGEFRRRLKGRPRDFGRFAFRQKRLYMAGEQEKWEKH